MSRSDEPHRGYGVESYRDKVVEDFGTVEALLTKFFINNHIPRENYKRAKHFREQYGRDHVKGILSCLGLKIHTDMGNESFLISLGQEKQMYQYPVEIKTQVGSGLRTYCAYIDTILSIAKDFVI